MSEVKTVFVGKDFIYNGQPAKAVAETDSGNVKIKLEKEEIWVNCGRLKAA